MKRTILIVYTILICRTLACAQTIVTIVGQAPVGTALGDGGPATSAFCLPYDVVVDRIGNIYISDEPHNRLRKVDTAGIITTWAGTGGLGSEANGCPATTADIDLPDRMAIDKLGNVYVSTSDSFRMVRMVSPSGIVTNIAGNAIYGSYHYCCDGSPATASGYTPVYGVAVGINGNIFLATPNDHRIRRVDASGIITTFAGNGSDGHSGDGGPASNAAIDFAEYVVTDTVGNLYISEEDSSYIRKVDTNGIITTIAGNGITHTYSGDGGPATAAAIFAPAAMATDRKGDLFVVEGGDSRIRKIDAAGIITTVAGNGTVYYDGDGSLATATGLGGALTSIFVDSAGDIFYTCDGCGVVRKILPYTLRVSVVPGMVAPQQQMQVYPNPSATGRYMIDIPTAVTETVQLTVTDVAGIVVASHSATTNAESSIQVTTPGTYIITATTAHNKWVTKVVYSP